MAITLKEAFAKNGTPDLTCFSALQAACKNPGYFNDSRPINRLSSWEGYYYYEGETIYQTTISLSDSAPSCFAGSVTATIYTYRKDKNTSGVWTDWYLYTGATPSLSENVDWLSCGAVSNNNTGTYSASVSFSCNCKTTSTRNCSISASANGMSASASLTQGADSYSDSGGGTTYEYGSWGGGAITFNSTSDLSCGADSRYVYIQPWTRTVTTVVAPKYRDWVCGGRETISSGSRTPWTDYYTGSVTVTENHDYTSLNTSSYTASSSHATLTLSKSSYGCNYADTSSVKVTAVGATTTSNSLGINANTYSDSGGNVTYGSWGGGAITFNSTSDLSCGADSRYVYIQPWTRKADKSARIRTFCTGCQTTLENASSWTDYYTGAVSVSENGSYTSLNTSSYTASSSHATLTLSKSSCGTDSTSRVYVTVTATPSGPSATSNGIYQAANSIVDTETNTGYQINNVSVNPTSTEYSNGAFTVSYNVQKRTQTRSKYCSGSWTPWSNWSSWSNVNGVKPSVSSNQSWARINSIGSTNSSGNGSASGTYDENTGGVRSTTITISYGDASNSATLTQSSAPNIIVNIKNGVRSWLSVNIDVLDKDWNTVTLATGDHNSSTSDGMVPVGTFNNWASLQQNTTSWPANIYFRDYDTLGNASSSFTVKFHLYNSSGQEVDTSKPISGNCNQYIDTTIEWIVGRDSNSDIAKMEIEISFS